MAPFMGPSREDTLRQLRRARDRDDVRITLGRSQPEATIRCIDGEWVLATLALDDEAARRAGEAALAAGEPWMPEMQWRFLRQGDVLARAASKTAFIALIEALPWPWS